MEVGFEQEAAEGAECSFFSGFSPPGRAFFGGTSGTSVTTRMNIGLSCHRKRHTEASQASHPSHSWEILLGDGDVGVLEWWIGEGTHRRARSDAPYAVPSSLGNCIWSPGFLPPAGAILSVTSVTSVTTRINIGVSCARKRHSEASQRSHP